MNEFVLRVQTSDAPGAPRDASEVVPVVDGRDLVSLIGSFERERGYEVPGEYGGIVIAFDVKLDGLRDHFLGEGRHGERTAVLGCNCGDLSCWPLLTTVEVDPEWVAWSDFRQPNRPSQEYSDFGPMRFDRSDYEDALERAVAELRSSS